MFNQYEFDLFQNDDFIGPNVDETLLQNMLRQDLEAKRYYVVAENVVDLPDEIYSKLRCNAFGASDASVLLGVAFSTPTIPMKTIEELIKEKVDETYDASIAEKASVRKGKELEPIFIKKLADRLKTTIIKPKDMYGNGEGLHTNFDGVLLEKIIDDDKIVRHIPIPVEIKLCTYFGRKNYNFGLGVSEFSPSPTMQSRMLPLLKETTNLKEHIKMNAEHYGIPAYYYTQVQQQIMFLQAPHGYLCVMDDHEWTLYLFKIPKDDFVIRMLKTLSRTAYNTLFHKKGIAGIPVVPYQGDDI